MLAEVKGNLQRKRKLIKKYSQGVNGAAIGMGLLLFRRIYTDLINHFVPSIFPEAIVFPAIALIGIGSFKLIYGIIKSIIYKAKLRSLEKEEKESLENAIDYVNELEKENKLLKDSKREILNNKKNSLNMLKQNILKQDMNLLENEEKIKTK